MKVVFLPAAEQDLGKLFTYMHDELKNPIAATTIATKILGRTQSLEDFPEMGASLHSIDSRLSDYRYLLVDNYLIIYSVGIRVIVTRVLYVRSDYTQLLVS